MIAKTNYKYDNLQKDGIRLSIVWQLNTQAVGKTNVRM
jgi:hypothetical protein